MQALLPDASFRSPTAVDGKSDMRDENIYSAVCVTGGASGQTTVFGIPRGQAIPLLGSGTAAAHQKTFTELTTNISQAGQLGAAIGDASIKRIGIAIENGWYDSSGALNTYGAGQQEVNELLSKTFFQLRIAGKLQIQGPTLLFPAPGGAFGSISTTNTTKTVSQATNGWPGSMRNLKLPILVGRTDTVEGTFGVAGGASLTFSVASGAYQPVLVWFNLIALVKGDVR
jgi:hypothetical protein